jgi:hypothetical protein
VGCRAGRVNGKEFRARERRAGTNPQGDEAFGEGHAAILVPADTGLRCSLISACAARATCGEGACLAIYGAGRDLAGDEGDGLGELKLEQDERVLGLLEQAPDPEARLVEALRARVLVQAPEGARPAQVAAVAVDGDGALPRACLLSSSWPTAGEGFGNLKGTVVTCYVV